jgi:Fe-S-cluster containining protein
LTVEKRLEQHLAVVTHQTVNAVLPLFAGGRSKEKLHRAVSQTWTYEEETKKALVTALARDPRCLPVCAPGCAFCCHLSVFASVPEILYLAEHLRRTLSPDRLAARTDDIVRAASAIADESKAERANSKRACPLLDSATRNCGVYAARPLTCRAYNSCDAGACERAFDQALTAFDLPVDLFQLTVSRNVRAGLMAAVLASGLDPGPYELVSGLSVALTVPDAEARWLSGEPIFAAAETRIGRERRAEWRESLIRVAREAIGSAL